ncbi:MAG: PilT/PilU family type 4a pilus ATPase, partial [Polyangiaceae bacterium]
VFLRGAGKQAPAAAAAPAAPAATVTPVPSAVPDGPRAANDAGQPSGLHPAVQVVAAQAPLSTHAPFGAGAPVSFEAGPDLTRLLSRASAMRATDIHLQDGEIPVLRVDGRLHAPSVEDSISIERLFGPELHAEALRRMATGASADLALSVPGTGRFRLNVFRSEGGVCAAIRLLRAAPPPLVELGAPVPLDDLIDLPHGLVILCGATGSGKSTTLASLAWEALARRASVVITLEDPIEYALASRGQRGLVRQRQVGRDVKDFATGLRDALREDPDILLIGEMRDPETISLALTAAETGHLVLASLHSRSAASAVERIVDAYPAERQQQIRVQIADSLRAVVAQRLVPRASGEGRALAVEVLRVNHAIANAIREARTGTIQSAIQSGRRDGMLPLERCLADLVQRRQISPDAARAAANDPVALNGYLTG